MYKRQLLLARAKFAKVISTFLGSSADGGLINKVESDGCIHPSFNQTVTATGRLSSSNPNGQNLPRKGTSPIKKVFKSRYGKIVNVDLSQIEYRVAAALSRDSRMVAEIRSGLDAHADNAEKLFKADRSDPDAFDRVRTTAKVLTFRLLYGGTASGFFKDSSMPTYDLKTWEEIVDGYWKKYPELKAWQNRNIEEMNKTGRIVSASGRIYCFEQSRGYNGAWMYSPRQACNFPVQGGSKDLMDLALAVIRKRLRDAGVRSKIILLVHDSIVFDAYLEEVDTICRIAIGVFESLPELAKIYFNWDICVPLTGDCEVGDDYGSLSKYHDWQNN